MFNHNVGPRKIFIICTAGHNPRAELMAGIILCAYRGLSLCSRNTNSSSQPSIIPRGCCHIPSLNLLAPTNFYPPFLAVRERASSGRQPLLLPGIGGR